MSHTARATTIGRFNVLNLCQRHVRQLALRMMLMVVGLGVMASAAIAEEPPDVGPQPQHAFLKKFVGEWDFKSQVEFGPGQAAVECQGKLRSRMLGEFWVVSDLSSTAAGMPMRGLQAIGFDPELGLYVGSWIDSTSSHFWRYTGDVDGAGQRLTLEADGPDMSDPGRMAKFRDIYEFVAADRVKFESQMQTDAGEWVTFVRGESKRIALPDPAADSK
jgi:hypothetical protein